MLTKKKNSDEKDQSIINLLFKIYFIIGKEQFRKGLNVLFVVFIQALLDIISIASIIPVLGLLSQKNTVIDSIRSFTANYYLFGNFTNNNFTDLIIIIVFVLITIAALYRVFSLYYLNKYVEYVRHSLSLRVLSKYVKNQYQDLFVRNSSEISKLLLSEIDQFIIWVFSPVIQMTSNIVLVTFIVLFLFATNFLWSSISLSFIFLFYFLFYYSVKNPLKRSGFVSSESNKDRFKYGLETFSSIKDIKIYYSEDYFINRFKAPSLKYAKSLSNYLTLIATPKYFLELIVILLMLSSTYFLNNSKDGFNNGLPLLGSFAFAAYRTQPALTSILHGINSIRYGSKMIDNIFNEIKSNNKVYANNFLRSNFKIHNDKDFSYILNEISYEYKSDDNKRRGLKNVSLKIPFKGLFLIVGKSGTGKSTLLDILSGLLKPQSGDIYISNHINLKSISYLHQQYSLTDSSIASNIAFGLKDNQIDFDRVKMAIKKAGLWKFVDKLPDKINSKVGENGAMLSGGQKQRLAIARALYFRSKILILDEPTSDLDQDTQDSIYKTLRTISNDLLVIMVTHKISESLDTKNILSINEDGSIQRSF